MADNGNNVVFLAFKSDRGETDTMSFFACKVCRNKTYTLTEDQADYHMLLRCAACGQHMGRMGWWCGEE